MGETTTLSARDLQTLVDTGRMLASEVNLGALLRGILDSAANLMDSPDGAVLLHDPFRDGLYFAAAVGDSAGKLLEDWGEPSGRRIPLMGSKAGEVFRSGETLVEVALEEGHYKKVDQATRHQTRSMVCVPLLVSEAGTGEVKRLGVIQILNTRAGSYTERGRLLLENFASQAAVAIRNARLFGSMLSRSGLYSRANPFELAERLRKPPGLERLTIMFPDMRGFTQLVQSLQNPFHVHELMNGFLTMLAEETLRFGGVVNKALGDGILAFFSGEDAARQAVECAFSIVGRFAHMRQQWDDSYNIDLSFLDVGIGISTGEVMVGTFGAGEMEDFTVMGVAVNLAAAFQSHARGGKKILADHATYSGARGVVKKVTELERFELKKPDQNLSVRYRQYHLQELKTAGGEEKGAPAGNKLRVFLCHSSGDKPAVRGLYARLQEDGFEPWLDEVDLLPGQDWQLEIKKAVKGSGAVVVCLTEASVKKEGFVQRELRGILDVADEKPDGTIFVIPVKLEKCSLPDRLTRLHSVELFEGDGYARLRRALETRAASIRG